MHEEPPPEERLPRVVSDCPVIHDGRRVPASIQDDNTVRICDVHALRAEVSYYLTRVPVPVKRYRSVSYYRPYAAGIYYHYDLPRRRRS